MPADGDGEGTWKVLWLHEGSDRSALRFDYCVPVIWMGVLGHV